MVTARLDCLQCPSMDDLGRWAICEEASTEAQHTCSCSLLGGGGSASRLVGLELRLRSCRGLRGRSGLTCGKRLHPHRLLSLSLGHRRNSPEPFPAHTGMTGGDTLG